MQNKSKEYEAIAVSVVETCSPETNSFSFTDDLEKVSGIC